MNAPIDIVINIINRHLADVLDFNVAEEPYLNGKADAYSDLILEFKSLKRLFS